VGVGVELMGGVEEVAGFRCLRDVAAFMDCIGKLREEF
jgi:hypothetical protein